MQFLRFGDLENYRNCYRTSYYDGTYNGHPRQYEAWSTKDFMYIYPKKVRIRLSKRGKYDSEHRAFMKL